MTWNTLVHSLAHNWLLLSVVWMVAGIAICLRLLRSHRSPPSVPGHWFFKNQKLLAARWRAPLLANVYGPMYGDIIQLSTRSKTVVVLNSLDAVTEVLEKQSLATSDRPRNVMLFELCEYGRGVGFRNRDETHRLQRRVMGPAMHPNAIRVYAGLHASTCAFFLREIANLLNSGSKHTHVSSTLVIEAAREAIGRFIMSQTYGHLPLDEDVILARAKKQNEFVISGLAKHFWVNNFPLLRHLPCWMPGAEFKREAKYRADQRQILATEPFEAVLTQMREGTIQQPSYVSQTLESRGGLTASREDLELVKWTAQPMFTAGSINTVALFSNLLFAMSIHPEVIPRMQAEIDTQVGRGRLPNLDDCESLPYTNAILQEVMRCYPAMPFALPHCASEDIQVRGYTIKKGTTIEGNVWALMHDPTMYPYPDTFNPNRFLSPNPDPDPRRFYFGFGRRNCVGRHVANNVALVMCAAFASVFDIEAGQSTLIRVKDCGKEVWRMFTPFTPLEPLPFECSIKLRDEVVFDLL